MYDSNLNCPTVCKAVVGEIVPIPTPDLNIVFVINGFPKVTLFEPYGPYTPDAVINEAVNACEALIAYDAVKLFITLPDTVIEPVTVNPCVLLILSALMY